MTESDPIPSSPGNLPESPRTNGGSTVPSRPSPVAHGRATVKSGDQTGTNGDRETWLLAAGSAAVTLGSEPACTALRSKATDVSTEYSGYIPAFRVDHRPKDRCSVTEELQQQLAVGGLTSSCRGMPYVSGRDSPEIMATRGDPINYTPPPPPEQSHGCTRPLCGKMKIKLKQAVEANRKWEKNALDLQRILSRRDKELDDLKRRYQHVLTQQSQREQWEEKAKRTNQELKARVQALEEELARTQVGLRRQAEQESVADLMAEMKVLKVETMDKDLQLQTLRKQVASLTEEVQREKREKKLARGAANQEQERYILARNQAESAQRNFLVILREKEVLLSHLERLSNNPASLRSQTDTAATA